MQGHSLDAAPRGRQARLVLLAQGRLARRAAGGVAEAVSRPVTRPTSTPNGSRCCGRCCSPSPTRYWARQPNPTTCCRTATCAGRRSTCRRVHDTKAYLARLVTRQALNALRAGARRREEYVGPWLPEPLLLDGAGCLGRRRARRIGVDGDAGGAGDARSRRTRGVRAARGVRLRLRRNRLGGRQIGAGGASGRAPCPRARAGPAQAVRARRPEAVDARSPRSSWRPRPPATWRG